METPTEITVCLLEVVVMPNGEVICNGRTLGWVEATGGRGLSTFLTPIDAWRKRERADAEPREEA